MKLHEGDWLPPEVDAPNPILERPDESAYYIPYHGDSMFECGGKVNRRVEGHVDKRGKHIEVKYKDYFLAIGFKKHVSVDFDMRWADHNDDLRLPLVDKFGTFDMFTNLGTSEHIETNQLGFWRNVHQMTNVGGLYIHLTPYPGGNDWMWHGQWYPTDDFIHSFAGMNGWVVEKIGVERSMPHRNLMARLRKVKDIPFGGINESLLWFNQRAPHVPLNR